MQCIKLTISAFRQSLDKTGLGAPLDVTRNVTCFTPDDAAFLQAGSPNATANITDLQGLVLFHTVVEPLYSNFLVDGQTFTTFSNETIRISLRGQDIFVNDAKVSCALSATVSANQTLDYQQERHVSSILLF